METVTFIVGIIVGAIVIILQVTLFFKIWGMTNDVARLTEFIINGKESYEQNHAHEKRKVEEFVAKSETETLDGLSIGTIVKCIPLNKELVILSIKDGKFECYSPSEAKSYGFFSRNDIEI